MSRVLCALLISFGILTHAYAEGSESTAVPAPATSGIDTSSLAQASGASAPAHASVSEAATAQTHRISSMLVEKFGLARAKAEEITNAVVSSASKYSLPPALVLAIISIESRFREKAHGLHGATGLMQVVPAAHRRLVSHIDLTEPAANIEAGSAILHGYIESAQGDVAAALKSYGGSSAYARKVSLRVHDFEAGVGASAPDIAFDASGAR
ncbi:transglycosylase-like protein with SLT domain [Trinickia symbiotica]|uniref:Lytic transglycosylase n=1 Tax=Trinickia symbiotica TaxID=863227 RepID=A0A2N7X490_9BURK|nr:transglycosylase SLT domain-containing protein [Trinickia symbiotica]PMS36391.1 lytic transglycosylase [Trinickia symbiotica]PPK44792.1 transglycosylase-like protein with SLT domain [Trinickia symbiotica]